MTLSSSAHRLIFLPIYVSLRNINVAIHQAHTDLERRSNTMTLQFNRPRTFPRFSFEFSASVVQFRVTHRRQEYACACRRLNCFLNYLSSSVRQSKSCKFRMERIGSLGHESWNLAHMVENPHKFCMLGYVICICRSTNSRN